MSITTDINAPIDEVWRVLSDIATWGDWMPTVKGSRRSDGTLADGVGAQYDLDLGGLDGTMTYTVTEAVPPTRLVISGRHLVSTYTLTYDLSALTPDATRLTSQAGADGLGAITEKLGGFDGQLRKEGAALKSRVEGGFSPRP